MLENLTGAGNNSRTRTVPAVQGSWQGYHSRTFSWLIKVLLPTILFSAVVGQVKGFDPVPNGDCDLPLASVCRTGLAKAVHVCNTGLGKAISEWEAGSTKYGDISEWEMGEITNMAGIFYGRTSFNADLSKWLVSNVTNMDSMFQGATSFNSDLSGWNVAQVPILRNTFKSASSFDQKWCNPLWESKIDGGDFEGSKGIMKCCSSGQYNVPQATAPFITCHKCMTGKFTAELNVEVDCQGCPTGWYQEESGRQFCYPCEPGTYQHQENQSQCEPCLAGQFSGVGKSSCTVCNKGEYQPQPSTSYCVSFHFFLMRCVPLVLMILYSQQLDKPHFSLGVTLDNLQVKHLPSHAQHVQSAKLQLEKDPKRLMLARTVQLI